MAYPDTWLHPGLIVRVSQGLAKVGGEPEITVTPRIPATQVVTTAPVPSEGAKMVPPDRQVVSGTTSNVAPVLLPGSMDTGKG